VQAQTTEEIAPMFKPGYLTLLAGGGINFIDVNGE
jgi:hypothetical protein